MRQLRRRTAGTAVMVGLVLVVAACGGGGGGNGNPPGAKPSAGKVVSVKNGGQIVYVLEKDVADWNILTANGNTFETAEVMNSIWPTAFLQLPDYSTPINKDLLVSADLTSKTPETVVYKIQPKAVWSDGTPITADDFIYTWTCLNGKDSKYTPASTTGYDSIKSVTGSDNGKTVTVVYDKPYADWKGLFGAIMPAHFMKTLSPDPHKAFNLGLTKTLPKVSGGPYMMTGFKHHDHVTTVKNPKWYGAPAHLDTIIYKIIEDATQEPTALQNNEVQAIYPQPEVDLVHQVEGIQGVTTNIGYGLLFEHFDFNLANPYLKDLTLRKALFTAVNRQQIVDATVKQFSDKAAVLNNRMLVPGQAGFKDNVTSTGIGNGNVNGAKQMLTQAGYKIQGGHLMTPSGQQVKPLRIRYTTGNAIRERECELFKAEVKPLGVDVKILPTDDLGGTLSTYDFDVIVFAWVGTPFPYSANRDIYITGGGSNFDHYSNPIVDQNLKDAAQQLDATKAQQDLNSADLQISKDAVTLPLYQKATFLAYYSKYANIFNNSTSVGPPYNTQQWGLKA